MSASVIVNDAPLVHACWNDEALDINNDNAGKNEHCFFLSVSDAWLQPGNPPSLKDHFQLRRVAKAWLRYNYNSLLNGDASTNGSKIIQTLPAKSRPQAHVHRLFKRRNG
jgi:hypothetical protein